MHSGTFDIKTPTHTKELMEIAVTKSYKKAPSNTASKIISEEKKTTENLNLDNTIDAFTAKNAFVTLKDLKPNFHKKKYCKESTLKLWPPPI